MKLFINFEFCSKIIWLGDLNYRLTASCRETHDLLEKNDWQTLLEKDQVRKKITVFYIIIIIIKKHDYIFVN